MHRMWTLVLTKKCPKANCSPQDIHLLCNTEYVVGRKDTDILLVEDQSISRKHATLVISFTQQNVSQPNCQPKLQLSDFSKFGTYVDEQKLSGGTVEVKTGSIIKFGQLHNSYRAEYTPLVVSTSAVPTADKEVLSQTLLQLGAHMVSEWTNDCIYLIMNRASITIKAICALSAGKMIVKTDYFTQYLQAVQNNTEIPRPEDYLPDMADGSDNSLLKSDTHRQTVFKDKKFYFTLKSQYERMRMCIDLASGSCVLLEKRPRSLSVLVNHGSILMHSEGDELPAWYKDSVTYINRRQLRCIQDAEVGHAILHCSTNDYCNPEMAAGERLYQHFTQKTSDQTQIQTRKPNVDESQVLVTNVRLKEPQPDKQTKDETLLKFNKRNSSVLELETQSGESSKRPKLGKRSVEGGQFLPPADVSRVAESQIKQATTQKQVEDLSITSSSSSTGTSRKTSVKIENDVTQLQQSISLSSTQSDRSERQKSSILVEETTHTIDNTLVQEITTSHIQANTVSHVDNTIDRQTWEETVNNTEAPTIPNIRTPEHTINEQDQHQIEDDIPDSHEKTTSDHEDVIKDRSNIKIEAREENDDVSDPLNQHVYNNIVKQEVTSDLSDERREQIGSDWDKVEVQFTALIRQTATRSHQLEHNDGKTLWNGVWMNNFKQFKKVGRKTQPVLPQIIGGSDLYNGLGSQAVSDVCHTTDGIDEPDHNPNLPPIQITSNNNALFGGAWELPV